MILGLRSAEFQPSLSGPVRLREALGCSLNVPAVFALSRLGARPMFHELQKWGFRFSRELSDYGAGFILGNAEIRLVDLAGAYAGLARNGVAMRAKLLPAEHHPMTRMTSAESTQIITDVLVIMTHAKKFRSAFAACLEDESQ